MMASCSSSPQRCGGTTQVTSNSRPSGSSAYRLLFTPWSLAPTRAPASASVLRIASSSTRSLTAQAMWYMPTVAPAGFGRAGAGADREERDVVVVLRLGRAQELVAALLVVDDQREAEHVPVERRASARVADVEDRVVHAGDGHPSSEGDAVRRPDGFGLMV